MIMLWLRLHVLRADKSAIIIIFQKVDVNCWREKLSAQVGQDSYENLSPNFTVFNDNPQKKYIQHLIRNPRIFYI